MAEPLVMQFPAELAEDVRSQLSAIHEYQSFLGFASESSDLRIVLKALECYEFSLWRNTHSKREQISVDAFVPAVLTSKPQWRNTIVNDAVKAKLATATVAKLLLEQAVATGRAFRWVCPGDTRAYYANIPQTPDGMYPHAFPSLPIKTNPDLFLACHLVDQYLTEEPQSEAAVMSRVIADGKASVNAFRRLLHEAEMEGMVFRWHDSKDRRRVLWSTSPQPELGTP